MKGLNTPTTDELYSKIESLTDEIVDLTAKLKAAESVNEGISVDNCEVLAGKILASIPHVSGNLTILYEQSDVYKTILAALKYKPKETDNNKNTDNNYRIELQE